MKTGSKSSGAAVGRLGAVRGGDVRALGTVASIVVQLLLLSGCFLEGSHLDLPVQSAQPASSVASSSSGGWLDYLNFYRATAWLSPVTENTSWSRGDQSHAVYLVKNGVTQHGISQHGEDRLNRWYTPEGQTAARQSNLAVSYDAKDSGWWAIDTWMQSPFHAVGVLDPRLMQVGYGSYKEKKGNLRMSAALNIIAGLDNTVKTPYPVFWPGNRVSIPISYHWGGYPSPLTSCPGYKPPSGLPLIVQMGSGDLTPVVSASAFTQNGRALEHCVFNETTYRNPDRSQQELGRSILGARDAIVLIPRAPLSTGTVYTASVTVNKKMYTWSFMISGDGQRENVQSFLKR